MRRRFTAQRVCSPACGLHAHGVRAYRLADSGCGRPHDPAAGFAFWNRLFVFEIVWNVFYFGSKNVEKRKSCCLPGSQPTHRQPRKYPSSVRPRRVCSYCLALSARSIFITRHGISCDGPAGSAHLVTSGLDSSRTKPNDVRCSLRQLHLEWVDGSHVHIIHAQQH